MAIDDGVDLVGALRRLVHALREAGDGLFVGAEQLEEARDVALVEAGGGGGGGGIRRDLSGARERLRQSPSCGRRYRFGRVRRCPRDGPAARRTTRCRCPARSPGTDRLRRRSRCGADRSPRSWRRVRGGCASCAGTAPDGTRRCSSRPGSEDRPGRGPRSSRAPRPRRRRGDGRRRSRPCTAASWCRRWPSRGSPSSACWRRNSPRSASGRRDRRRPRPARRARSTRRKPSATVDSAVSQSTRAWLPSARRSIGCSRRPFEAERLLQRKALRAQPPEIRRMVGIAGGDGAAGAVRPRRHAAADAAIGAGGSRDGRERDRRVHGINTRPSDSGRPSSAR